MYYVYQENHSARTTKIVSAHETKEDCISECERLNQDYMENRGIDHNDTGIFYHHDANDGNDSDDDNDGGEA